MSKVLFFPSWACDALIEVVTFTLFAVVKISHKETQGFWGKRLKSLSHLVNSIGSSLCVSLGLYVHYSRKYLGEFSWEIERANRDR